MKIQTTIELIERLEAIRVDLDETGSLRWARLYVEDLLDDCRDAIDAEERREGTTWASHR